MVHFSAVCFQILIIFVKNSKFQVHFLKKNNKVDIPRVELFRGVASRRVVYDTFTVKIYFFLKKKDLKFCFFGNFFAEIISKKSIFK